MTSHRNLHRLEQILEKCLREHQTSSGNAHAKDERIQILIDAQTNYEKRFGKIVDRSARCDELFARYYEDRAKYDERDDPFMEVLISIQKDFQD